MKTTVDIFSKIYYVVLIPRASPYLSEQMMSCKGDMVFHISIY